MRCISGSMSPITVRCSPIALGEQAGTTLATWPPRCSPLPGGGWTAFPLVTRRSDGCTGSRTESCLITGVASAAGSDWKSGCGRWRHSRHTVLKPQVVRRHEYDLVIEASTNLRPLDQEVLRLAIWEELGHAEIADLLDSTVPAVRQRFHRAKRALAKQYERIGGVLPPPAVAQEGVSDDT